MFESVKNWLVRSLTEIFVPAKPDVLMDGPAGEALRAYESLQKMARKSKRSKSIVVKVNPLKPDGGLYRFSVKNISSESVRDLKITFTYVFQSTDFGWDDTYGPLKMPSGPYLEVSELCPGDSVFVDADKMFALSDFRGPFPREIAARFAGGRERKDRAELYVVKLLIDTKPVG